MKEAALEVERLRQSCDELEAEAERLETRSAKVAKLAARYVIPALVLSGEVVLPGLLDLRLASRHASLGAVLAAENAERNGVLTEEDLRRALSKLHVEEHTAGIVEALPPLGQE